MATITDIKTAQLLPDAAAGAPPTDATQEQESVHAPGDASKSEPTTANQKEPASDPADLYGRLKEKLERIALVRQRPLFVLLSSFIDSDTVTKIYDWRNELRPVGAAGPLDVVIVSPGGDLSACYIVARLLSRWTNQWDALIPSFAASGATLICLGSEHLVMSEVAQIGPLDPQVISKRREKFFLVERQSPLEAFEAVKYLRRFSLESLDTTMQFLLQHMITPQHALETAAKFSAELAKPILDKIDPYDLGSFSLDSRVSMGYCHRVCNPTNADQKAQRTAKFQNLVEKYPAHEFVIDIEEARALGFAVTQAEGELDELFHQLRGELEEGSDFECIGLVTASGKGATS